MSKFFTSGRLLARGTYTSFLTLHIITQGVAIGLAKSPSLNREESFFFQSLNKRIHTLSGDSNIFCKSLLTRKDFCVVPRVGEKHRKRHFLSHSKIIVFQNKIRDLRKAFRDDRIIGFEDDVLVSFYHIANAFHVIYYAMLCKFTRCGYLVFIFFLRSID